MPRRARAGGDSSSSSSNPLQLKAGTAERSAWGAHAKPGAWGDADVGQPRFLTGTGMTGKAAAAAAATTQERRHTGGSWFA